MLKKPVIYYWSPVALFFVMLIDSHITGIFKNMTQNQSYINSHLLIFLFMLLSFYVDRHFLIITAILLGFIYDSYYTGVIGIYMLCPPLFVGLYLKLFQRIKPSIAALLFELIISVTFVEMTVFILQAIFKISTIGVMTFIARLMGPTLLLNIVFFVFLVYPARKFFSLTEKEAL